MPPFITYFVITVCCCKCQKIMETITDMSKIGIQCGTVQLFSGQLVDGPSIESIGICNYHMYMYVRFKCFKNICQFNKLSLKICQVLLIVQASKLVFQTFLRAIF
jgi:hypothetical protein